MYVPRYSGRANNCTVSLGKSSRASLEKLYAQTSVLLEDLRQDGGDGAFVSVQDVVDDVTDSI
jgi:Ran-binding protein 9/10